jgi:uncharacterized protein (DUF1778 family)
MSRKTESDTVLAGISFRRQPLREIDTAAKLTGQNRSRFVEDASLERARRVIGDTIAKTTLLTESPK